MNLPPDMRRYMMYQYIKNILPAWILTLIILPGATAQDWKEEITQQRQAYIQAFLTGENSPLKAGDTAFLRFYPPDSVYRVVAQVERIKGNKTFRMPTYDGRHKPYRKYARLHFRLQGQLYQLEAYQRVVQVASQAYKDYLFLPFRDLTNYESTYGGGRYLDFSIKDIKDGTIVLDFNKSYNPYCAYASGYSCPIPPEVNTLRMEIPAGEMTFGKAVE